VEVTTGTSLSEGLVIIRCFDRRGVEAGSKSLLMALVCLYGFDFLRYSELPRI
jgi:hypothetical protein